MKALERKVRGNEAEMKAMRGDKDVQSEGCGAMTIDYADKAEQTDEELTGYAAGASGLPLAGYHSTQPSDQFGVFNAN